MKLKVEGEIEIGNVEELGDACGRLFEKAKSILDAEGPAPERTTVHWPTIFAEVGAKKPDVHASDDVASRLARAAERKLGAKHRFPDMRWS